MLLWLCFVFIKKKQLPDYLSSFQCCRIKCEDSGRRSVCIRGAGGEDHPDARLMAEREAWPRGPAHRRRRGRRNMWRLLFSGLDRTNMLSFTHTFNHTHVNTTCSQTYKHTHPPTVCCGALSSEGPHTLPLSTCKLQFAQLRITALHLNADAVQPSSKQTMSEILLFQCLEHWWEKKYINHSHTNVCVKIGTWWRMGKSFLTKCCFCCLFVGASMLYVLGAPCPPEHVS